MTRFRSVASKSFGLSDRARIRDGDKFHAACLLACTDRNFPPRRSDRGWEETRKPATGHRSPSVREFTDTSRGVLIFISCPVSFLRPTPTATRLPFREGVNAAQGLGSNYRLNFIGNIPQGRFTRVQRYEISENLSSGIRIKEIFYNWRTVFFLQK